MLMLKQRHSLYYNLTKFSKKSRNLIIFFNRFQCLLVDGMANLILFLYFQKHANNSNENYLVNLCAERRIVRAELDLSLNTAKSKEKRAIRSFNPNIFLTLSLLLFSSSNPCFSTSTGFSFALGKHHSGVFLFWA